jgi:hypothetical protein
MRALFLAGLFVDCPFLRECLKRVTMRFFCKNGIVMGPE